MSQISEKLKPIDLNDLLLEEETLQLDPDADAFQGPPPPPDGAHIAKLSLFSRNGESPFQLGKDKYGRPYIMAAVKANLVAPGRSYDRAAIFDRVSTIIFDNDTCRMGGVLKELGITLPASTTARALAKMLETALEGEPLIGIETRWEARAQHGEKWETFLKGMKRFPQRESGSYDHIVDDPVTGEKVTAQATILRYLPAHQVKG